MNEPSNFTWEKEGPTDRKLKPISDSMFRTLGLNRDSLKIVETLEDLKKNPPNIVIATATKNLTFIQNHFKQQTLRKKEKYVMGLGVYQQLFSSPPPSKIFLKPSGLKFSNVYRPYVGENLDNKTLLVFRTGGIGDLLFIQPNLIFLKEKYPSCKIKFACGPQYQSMVDNWSCIDEVLDLPFHFKELLSSDYHALFEGVIERCKLAQTVNSYNLFSSWLGLDLPNDLLIPVQEVKQEKLDFCQKQLSSWGIKPKDFIIGQLRASSPIRSPAPKVWADLFNSLIHMGHNIVITDNPRQYQAVDDFISKYIEDKTKVFNFAKESSSLDYSIAMVSLSQCSVGTDSALNHIAASVGVPCYGLFGPFPGDIRLKTYPRASWVNATHHCTPCYLHGVKPCPQAGTDGFSPCYNNIDIKRSAQEIQDLIETNK